MSEVRDLVFLSFRVSESLVEARLIKTALTAQGFKSFVSQDDLLPGQDWPTALADNLDRAAVVVALATETYGAKGSSTQGTFEELRFAKKKGLPLIVVKMCDNWKETRTEMELGSIQCLSWSVGTPLPAEVLRVITEQLAVAGVSSTTSKVTSQLAQASIISDGVSWESLDMGPALQQLFVQHDVKQHVAKKMMEELGLSHVNDLQFIDKDMVAQLKLKPLEAAALNRLLQSQQQKVPEPAAAAARAAARPASARFQQKAGAAAVAAVVVAPTIKEEPAVKAPAATATVTVHPHELFLYTDATKHFNPSSVGWTCDGKKLPGGCKKGCTTSKDSVGWLRYRSRKVDYDLCEGCLAAYAGPSEAAAGPLLVTVHPHPLFLYTDATKHFNPSSVGWTCDGKKLPGGCKKGCTTSKDSVGWLRFRSTKLDYDLCEGCLAAYKQA